MVVKRAGHITLEKYDGTELLLKLWGVLAPGQREKLGIEQFDLLHTYIGLGKKCSNTT